MAAAGDRPRPRACVRGQHGLDDLVEVHGRGVDEVDHRVAVEHAPGRGRDLLDLFDDQIQVVAHVGRGAPEASGGLGERQHRRDGLPDLVQRRAQALLDVPEDQLLEASAPCHDLVGHETPLLMRSFPPRRALGPPLPRRRAASGTVGHRRLSSGFRVLIGTRIR